MPPPGTRVTGCSATAGRGQANLIWKIAGQPRADVGRAFTPPRFPFKVRRIIDGAKAEGAVPVMAVMRAEATQLRPDLPGRAGGRADRVREAGTAALRG